MPVAASLRGRLRALRGAWVLPLGWLAAAGPLERLSAQDARIVAQVLHFSDGGSGGEGRIAVVYDGMSSDSRDEAAQAMTVLAGVPSLRPVLVEQSALADTTGIAALLTTAGVSPGPVRAAMQQHHLPCLTLHESQVRDGACLVGIRSLPSVAITLNQAAAEAAGVRFATAFRMMVREL